MLIQGHFRGIRLFYDLSQDEGFGWNASKKNCFRLWKNNYDVMLFDDWVSLFEDMECNHSMKSWVEKEIPDSFFDSVKILQSECANI
jgi:hypothetical protein